MNLLKQEENGILCVTMDDRFEKYMAIVEDRQKGGYYANVSIFNKDTLSGVVTLPGLLAMEKQQDGKTKMYFNLEDDRIPKAKGDTYKILEHYCERIDTMEKMREARFAKFKEEEDERKRVEGLAKSVLEDRLNKNGMTSNNGIASNVQSENQIEKEQSSLSRETISITNKNSYNVGVVSRPFPVTNNQFLHVDGITSKEMDAQIKNPKIKLTDNLTDNRGKINPYHYNLEINISLNGKKIEKNFEFNGRTAFMLNRLTRNPHLSYQPLRTPQRAAGIDGALPGIKLRNPLKILQENINRKIEQVRAKVNGVKEQIYGKVNNVKDVAYGRYEAFLAEQLKMVQQRREGITKTKGAIVGTTIGSALGPVGTAVGKTVGGVAGGVAGVGAGAAYGAVKGTVDKATNAIGLDSNDALNNQIHGQTRKTSQDVEQAVSGVETFGKSVIGNSNGGDKFSYSPDVMISMVKVNGETLTRCEFSKDALKLIEPVKEKNGNMSLVLEVYKEGKNDFMSINGMRGRNGNMYYFDGSDPNTNKILNEFVKGIEEKRRKRSIGITGIPKLTTVEQKNENTRPGKTI